VIESIISFFCGDQYDVYFGEEPSKMEKIGRIRAKDGDAAIDKAQIITVNYFWCKGMFVDGKPVHGVYEARRVKP